MVNLRGSLIGHKEAENFAETSAVSENVPSNNTEISSQKVDTPISHEPTIDSFTFDNISEEQNMAEPSDKMSEDFEEDHVRHPNVASEVYAEDVDVENGNQRLNASSNHNDHTAGEIQTVLPLYQPKKELTLNGKATDESEVFYFLNVTWQSNLQLSHLFDQLRNMFIERQLLDCTLVCEDQCIKAHKLVLAAVSPYFRSIFNSFGNFGCSNTAIIVQNVPARDMKLIVKIIYSVDSDPIRLNQNRAISLRKSVHRLKIDFINEKLDQSGIPQLSEDQILSLSKETDSDNGLIHNRKRKRSYQDQSKVPDTSIDSLVGGVSIDKQQVGQFSSESTDENSSECSSSMKHLKYKNRYLLSNGHLAKCGNDDAPQDSEMDEREEDLQNEEGSNCEEGNEFKNLDTRNQNSTCQAETKSSDYGRRISGDNEILNSFTQIKKSTYQIPSQLTAFGNLANALEDKELDLSMNKHSNQENVLKLGNSAANINNVDNNDKVANLYKAMKCEIKKLWTNNSDLNCNDSLNQLNNQFLNKQTAQNNLANDIISQFYMAGANLNPETARALLFTNELLKNNAVNNQLQHSINKHSTDNSLNTSTSSTNSSIGNTQQANSSSATAALVAAAQQQILNASFLNKSSSSNSVAGKQSSMNGALLNSSKSNRSLSSNSYNTQNSTSSSNSSINSSNGAPVKRGRGRPPRHTQPPNGSESGSLNGDQILSSKATPAQSKTLKQHSTSPSLSNITNLNNFADSTATSIADALNAFNQEKKWRPNLENLLALKMRKNKLSSGSAGTGSLTNDIGTNSSLMKHSPQSNLLTNGSLTKSSTPSHTSSGNFAQNGSPSINNSNNTIAGSTNSVNGPSSTSGNSTANQNVSNDGKNCCPVRTKSSTLT